jgi:hypothetical protein
MKSPNEESTDPELETTEQRIDAAENLRLEAKHDGVKDISREAEIDELESAGDLVEDAIKDRPVGAFRGERKTPDRKINPVRVNKSWHVKSERTQRRILQQKLGSYSPEADDPVPQNSYVKAVSEGSLFDRHPLSRVRQRDVEATRAIRTAIPDHPPVKPPPRPAPPAEGRCWRCRLPIRKSGKNKVRAGTHFCTDNRGECRIAFNDLEAYRDERTEIWTAWNDSQHETRMLSIHRLAATAMRGSADRCGIDATFVATVDGILVTHDAPLPPIRPGVCVQGEAQDGTAYDGYIHQVAIVATDTDAGTMYTFEMQCRPKGIVRAVLCIEFEGDPGVSPPKRTPPPKMSASFAARNGRVAEYLAARKMNIAA